MGFIDQMRAEGHAVESIVRVLREQGVKIAARTYRTSRAVTRRAKEEDQLHSIFDIACPTLGFCTSGVAAGLYIGVFPLIASEQLSGAVWDARLSGDVPEEGLELGDTFVLDPSDSRDAAFLNGLGVVVVPEPAASRGIWALFSENLKLTTPRYGPGRTGRFHGREALARILSELESTTDRPDAREAVNRSRRWLDDAGSAFDQLSEALGEAGLTLAIRPQRTTRTRPEHVWDEYLT